MLSVPVQYTLDMLTIDFKVSSYGVQKIFDLLMSPGYDNRYGEFNYWNSSAVSKFKHNFVFEVSREEHYFMGVQANWMTPSQYNTYVRLEFNPAKLFACHEFCNLHRHLISAAIHVDVKKFDLAIDIPVPREDCFMFKDQRVESMRKYSESNKTNYLGLRGDHGNVKLYNKQLESNLPYPLTRLEITMDYEHITELEFQSVFPKVLFFDSGQMKLDDTAYDGVDRVLLLACLEHPEYLSMLHYRKRKKIECILGEYTHTLEPDMNKYRHILSEILKYCKPFDVPV